MLQRCHLGLGALRQILVAPCNRSSIGMNGVHRGAYITERCVQALQKAVELLTHAANFCLVRRLQARGQVQLCLHTRCHGLQLCRQLIALHALLLVGTGQGRLQQHHHQHGHAQRKSCRQKEAAAQRPRLPYPPGQAQDLPSAYCLSTP